MRGEVFIILPYSHSMSCSSRTKPLPSVQNFIKRGKTWWGNLYSLIWCLCEYMIHWIDSLWKFSFSQDPDFWAPSTLLGNVCSRILASCVSGQANTELRECLLVQIQDVWLGGSFSARVRLELVPKHLPVLTFSVVGIQDSLHYPQVIRKLAECLEHA